MQVETEDAFAICGWKGVGVETVFSISLSIDWPGERRRAVVCDIMTFDLRHIVVAYVQHEFHEAVAAMNVMVGMGDFRCVIVRNAIKVVGQLFGTYGHRIKGQVVFGIDGEFEPYGAVATVDGLQMFGVQARDRIGVSVEVATFSRANVFVGSVPIVIRWIVMQVQGDGLVASMGGDSVESIVAFVGIGLPMPE